jgi:hypothetical protein
MIYTHVLNRGGLGVRNPAARLLVSLLPTGSRALLARCVYAAAGTA